MIINKNTLVPLSLVATIIAGTFVVSSFFIWLKTTLYSMDLKITNIQYTVSQLASDNVSMKDFENWIKVLKAQNDHLNVPDF